MKLFGWAISLSLIPVFAPLPALSAERLYLSYGLLEQSISIDSLNTFAKTGHIDGDLAAYAKQVDLQRRAQLRQLLVSPIPLDAVAVSQFLYTPIGEELLSRLGSVIRTRSKQSGFYALRAALILAADDPEGLTPLTVLQNFPLQGIDIDLASSIAIADALNRLVNQTEQAVALVKQQSQQEAANTALPVPLPSLEPPGQFAWKKQTIILTDQPRKRLFPTDIYLPSVRTPRPVIVISHGLGSDRFSFAYLAAHLASYGFVVAVPEHPGSSASQLQALFEGRAAEVAGPREFIDRPQDIQYLLNELDRLSQSDSRFAGRLNLQEVGVVGQSFGGYTALALAGAKLDFQNLQTRCESLDGSLNVSLLLQCRALELPQQPYQLADPRVKAVIAIDPIDSSILGPNSLSQIAIPTLMVAGSADTISPALPEQIQPFTWLTTGDRYLALLRGGTHFSTIAPSPNDAVPIPDSVIGPSPALARRYIRILGVAFFQTYLEHQPRYQPYLSAAYANTISQPPLPLNIVQSLTSAQLSRILKPSAP